MNYAALAIAAVGAVGVLYFLNASIAATPFPEIEGAETVPCSSVLDAESGDETLNIRLSEGERNAVHGACDQARTERLGWTIIVALPTAIAGALIAPRRRDAESPR